MLRGLVGLLAIVPTSAFMMAWESKFYVRQAHLAPTDVAGYLMISALVYDLGALLFGDLASRRANRDAPPRLLVAAGGALAAAGMVVLAFASSPSLVLLGMALGAIGRGALVTLFNSDTIARMPRGMVSASGGVIASVQSLGGVLVNPLVGAAVQRSGYVGVVIALAAWTVPGCVAWIAWRPPAPEA
jgi:hypothetical protein